VERFWLPLNDNINLQKYTQILDTNLKPFCCRKFRRKTFIFKDNVHQHAVDNSRELKTKKNFSGGTTWPAWSPDLNITENVLLAIILKLHIETDMIKTRADAICDIWILIIMA